MDNKNDKYWFGRITTFQKIKLMIKKIGDQNWQIRNIKIGKQYDVDM